MFEGERAFLKTLNETQWLPPAELAAYQDRLLERLCRHAALQCDAYGPRLKRLFVSGDARRGRFQRDNWDRIPIMTRADAARLGAGIHARSIPPAAGIVTDLHTSGTTGRPLALKKNSLATLANLALFARRLQDWGMAPDRPLASIASHPDALPPDGLTGAGWNILAPEAAHHFMSSAATIDEMVDWLLRRRPTYLRAYPSNAASIIEALDRRGEQLELDAVFTSGETVPDDLPAAVRRAFGGRLVDAYGLREVGDIAGDCPVSGLKHITAESMLAEVLRDDGSPCAPGEIGRMVATPLYVYATPLIRYDTGDRVVQGPERCACGRTLPTIERVIGRERQVFRYPDGLARLPAGINRVGNHLSYRRCQLVQVDGWRVEFRYVPDQPVDEAGRAAAIAVLRELTHPRAEIHLTPVDDIPRGAGGKYEQSISLVPRDFAGR